MFTVMSPNIYIYWLFNISQPSVVPLCSKEQLICIQKKEKSVVLNPYAVICSVHSSYNICQALKGTKSTQVVWSILCSLMSVKLQKKLFLSLTNPGHCELSVCGKSCATLLPKCLHLCFTEKKKIRAYRFGIT